MSEQDETRKFEIQLFRHHTWQNTKWGGNDREEILQRGRDIAKSCNSSFDIKRVRVIEVLLDLDCKDAK